MAQRQLDPESLEHPKRALDEQAGEQVLELA